MTPLPPRYGYLTAPDVPAVIREALNLLGTIEFKGADDNPLILAWAKEIGSNAGMQYDHDEIPWCGLFAAVCVKRAGFSLPSIAVRASSWDGWGQQADMPRVGDVLRFQRAGGGHVGFYVAEDTEAFHVLGGNQGDAVTIARIAKPRLVAARRGWPLTPGAVRVVLSAGGGLSNKEV